MSHRSRVGTRLPWVVAGLSLMCSLVVGRAAEDPFRAQVRPTDKLSPEEQLKTFKVPEGFELQLVAADPDILKPMNLAFDVKGRVWATVTQEYPHPAPVEEGGRDAIKILEDTDGDGKADIITTFAEGLNIPIGLYPFVWYDDKGREQWTCVAWSIPNVWFITDVDGDGKADEKLKLYGEIDYTRDTHGNISSFTRGFDGRIYGTHGFRNETTVAGADGIEVKLFSGNTYRFEMDGSAIEHYTHGQVNPFGMCLDHWGNHYTADCHSSPVYQLLRGAYYPSFGKPGDGLGFGPTTIQHSHGSTAISGIVYLKDPIWPAEYQDNIFIGNVMTSRLNRDQIRWQGSSSVGYEMPDLLETTDPWFRPVNIQLGPDGALYIADFYNKIIGHYEVPLDHPERDRTSGRIWKLVPLDDQGKPANYGPLPKLRDYDGWLAQLGHPNLTRRMLATHYIADSIFGLTDKRAAEVAGNLGQLAVSVEAPAEQRAHALWVLHRGGGLAEPLMYRALNDPSPLVRNHLMRILADLPVWDVLSRWVAMQGLLDSDAMVQRAAADAIGAHGDRDFVRPLMYALSHCSEDDAHLKHTLRMALRDRLALRGVLGDLSEIGFSENESRQIADVCLGIESEESASFLLGHVREYQEKPGVLVSYVKHAARFLPEGEMEGLAAFARERFAKNSGLQLELFKSVREALARRGSEAGDAINDWGASLAGELLTSVDKVSASWSNTPIEGMSEGEIPWFLQERKSDDEKEATFICSLPPGGEKLTGVLRSSAFKAPKEFSFFLAGHDGFPDKPAQKRNVVRLREAGTQAILAEQYPFRHDTARKVTWDLTDHEGKQVFLEVTDADNGTAFAWLAVGRFQPPVVKLPKLKPSEVEERQLAAAELAGDMKLAKLEKPMRELVAAESTMASVRAAAAKALLALNPDPAMKTLAPLIADKDIPAAIRGKIGVAIASGDANAAGEVLEGALASSPNNVQRKIALALASSGSGGKRLFDLVESGKAPGQLLLDPVLKERLTAVDAKRHAVLTKDLPPMNEAIEKKIKDAYAAYRPGSASAVAGAELFQKNCAACHQVGGVGGLVGPQLDGIGTRGAHRLLEDVLDPNRYLDPGFRAVNIEATDDRVYTGLPRREEGELLIFADVTGKEISLKKSEIVEQRQSQLSLMPANFGDLLKPAELNDLVAFLMSK